ncbi:MAG: LAGLIDADG family homing endonuclease [bacterium]
MSKIIASAAIRGAHKIAREAETRLFKAIDQFRPNQNVEFPNTGYYLPIIYAMTGIPVKTLSDCEKILKMAKDLLPEVPAKHINLPYLGETLDAGMATLWNEEIIEVLKYLEDPCPYLIAPSPNETHLYIGAADDKIMRERGIEFVDGSAPGFAACAGCCPDKETAAKLARELQEKTLYVFLHAENNGISMAEQLREADVQLGWETRLVPFGKDIYSAVFALGFASRAAMSFGGVSPGDYRRNLLYNRHRVFAFVLALGEVSDEWYATAAGAINYGFPVISYTPIPEILPTGVCMYEHVVSNVPFDKMVEKAMFVRGLKVITAKIDLPVSYGPAFSGERIRKEDMFVEINEMRTGKPTLEYVTTKPSNEVEDGKIELIGPDLDEIEEGGSMALGIWVEVAGARMQKDFEPILERHIHESLNAASGVLHMGQRDIGWIRINKEAYKKGFRLHHIGKIIYAKFHHEYSSILDKVSVFLYTEEEKIKELREIARKVYQARDERMAGLTDEGVDVFYSCTLCQSFAPNHVCIVTPERSGLCGAYNWLDTKAAHQISPTGPNQPIEKGNYIDEGLGQWDNVNRAVFERSHNKIERMSAYSIMVDPMTSCITGDSCVIIDNNIISIGEFIDKNHGKEDYAKSSCFTLNEGRVKGENLVAIQRFVYKKGLVEIRTKSGAKLTLTPNHRIAIDRPSGITWIPADEIKKNDKIISLKNLEIKEEIPEIAEKKLLCEDLFYILGLIASDGSVTHRGRSEYIINFINTQRELLEEYIRIYKALFPSKNIGLRKKRNVPSSIKGRIIKGTIDCYDAYTNNHILGKLCEEFGIKVGKKGDWDLEKIIRLPKIFIASFLSGLFDGDGSIRTRKYEGKWDVSDAYFCIEDEKAAFDLGLMLKRFGIIGNIRKASSVYKIEVYGDNLKKLCDILSLRHPRKKEILERIRNLEPCGKTQSEMLPYSVGKAIAQIPESKEILPPSTLFYYKTGRSRPTLKNVEKIIEASRLKFLNSMINSDFFLDSVVGIEKIPPKERYVYNLTLDSTHCYFANSLLIQNCGCFECISVVLPSVSGIMIVDRDHSGMTPCGMKFSTLAGSVGGGQQTPGFTGHSKFYIGSKKYLKAEGGIKRLVWMPQKLKNTMADVLKRRGEEEGIPDLFDLIATEEATISEEGVLSWCKRMNHPVLKMEPII